MKSERRAPWRVDFRTKNSRENLLNFLSSRPIINNVTQKEVYMKKRLNRRQLRKLLLREMNLITEETNVGIDKLRVAVDRIEYNGDNEEIAQSMVSIRNILKTIITKLERIKGA